ncbi:LysM domain-containing protein [Cytobacillus sp. FJAT-54145]|uniref:LysM domain-containing protein n=1 Tax=Cytobacillus spartinae TaxID=3299023 RepID=A0ABW6KCK0_9BACI
MKKATKLLAPTLALGMVFGASSFSANAETVTIESGDTLWGIAQEHNVTVDELMSMNSDLDPRAIPAGTEIQISESKNNDNENVVRHVIQPGNTLNDIAAIYEGVSVDDLYALNPDIDPYALVVGDEIVVVDYTRESTNDPNVVYHTVQPGNTFYNIASVYDGVTVNDLIEANPNVDIYSLTIGSEIVIPLE